MENVEDMLGNGDVTYKNLLNKEMMPVTFHCSEKDGNTERMWLAGILGDKWTEDYIVIRRDEYETNTDDSGAIYAFHDGIRKLVKAPNVEYFRIPEDVDEICEHALRGCPDLKKLDIPYTIDDYHLDRALECSDHEIKVVVWDWCYEYALSKKLIEEINDGNKDEYGFVYSKDGKCLLKAAKVKEYWIPEGVERIERLAFVGCPFKRIHVPYTCRLGELPIEEYPVFGSERVAGVVTEWSKPYSHEIEEDDPFCSHDEDVVIDKYGVAYSRDWKRLMWSTGKFTETDYNVPDGVETICSRAFLGNESFITLNVPNSIKLIGDALFGDAGGRIVFRKSQE